MVKSTVRIERNQDAATATRQGAREWLRDFASVGFDKSQEIVADEATDTGQLLRSGIPPEFNNDGSIQWGYVAGYAEAVDQGQPPTLVPIADLLGWARRVLGDESAAYPVQKKIAEEGTEPVEFMSRSVEQMRSWAGTHNIDDFVVERL